MFTNSIYTGSKLLDRVQKIAQRKKGASYNDIGLITPKMDDKKQPYFIVNDNAMDKICTVSKTEIKAALKQGVID